MDVQQLIDLVRLERAGVVATLAADGAPQAAYLSIAATDRGELVFDAKPDSRKVANLRRDPRIAVVVGGDRGVTLQCEGVADLPTGAELERCTAAYLAAFPEFASSFDAGAVVVLRVLLDWARSGDFRGEHPLIEDVELGAPPA
ncbi:pyridoxamine 5'-phosphate oxidase family protein [Agromyces larvae]|uniref:Pyridoxamine 5'-phosphate oxidase family protein n=1 Tax=Agromyces larvae TaxID=2929802 RepID=A0ABY4C2E0_9MICO|nr:pyridoxamine 5'-phosphate oxidase family protein [Agromyces larvae]UOE44171.1 pyridoxamine 5'-phosphate oxidase family protein [Agromyces larvae]